MDRNLRRRAPRDDRRRRHLERQRAAKRLALRRELAAELRELAVGTENASPAELAAWLVDQVNAGRLAESDVEAAYEQLASVVGPVFANAVIAELTRPSRGPNLGPKHGSGPGTQAGKAAEPAIVAPKAGVHDRDAARQATTAALLDRLAADLGLGRGAIQVYADAEGQRRTEGASTRGLMADGQIFLHPKRYDPTTPDGRGLLAHEMTHIAQKRLTGRTESRASGVHAEPCTRSVRPRPTRGGSPRG